MTRLWATRIGHPEKGESVPAAPIAWSGLMFAGNAGRDNHAVKGRMYALDATGGATLWSHDPRGAIGGGVIRYAADGKQRIAVAAGMTSPIWPTEGATAKIVVFGLE